MLDVHTLPLIYVLRLNIWPARANRSRNSAVEACSLLVAKDNEDDAPTLFGCRQTERRAEVGANEEKSRNECANGG